MWAKAKAHQIENQVIERKRAYNIANERAQLFEWHERYARNILYRCIHLTRIHNAIRVCNVSTTADFVRRLISV